MIQSFTKGLTLLILMVASTTISHAEEINTPKVQIIIGYAKSTAAKDIAALESKFGLKEIKKFKRIYAICYESQSTQKFSDLIKKIQEEKIVRYAERNGKVAKKS
jgi:hypothetical protein